MTQEYQQKVELVYKLEEALSTIEQVNAFIEENNIDNDFALTCSEMEIENAIALVKESLKK